MLVEDIIRIKGGDVLTIGAEISVIEAARLMAAKKIGILAVCHVGQRLAGLLSERDIIRALAEQGEGIAELTVDKIYVREVVTCGLQDDPRMVMRTMTERGFRHMPVVEYGVLKGMISSRDILKYFLDESTASEQASMWSDINEFL